MDININDLDKLKLDELREIGKNLSIKSLSSYRKNELVEIIKEAYRVKILKIMKVLAMI